MVLPWHNIYNSIIPKLLSHSIRWKRQKRYNCYYFVRMRLIYSSLLSSSWLLVLLTTLQSMPTSVTTAWWWISRDRVGNGWEDNKRIHYKKGVLSLSLSSFFNTTTNFSYTKRFIHLCVWNNIYSSSWIKVFRLSCFLRSSFTHFCSVLPLPTSYCCRFCCCILQCDRYYTCTVLYTGENAL